MNLEKLGNPRLSSIVGLLGSYKFSYLFVFLVGVILRAIPELIVSSYPIGYETITYYAPPMFAFGDYGFLDVFVEFFRASPLFYCFMWFIVFLSRAHPFLILKMVGPFLYGILAVTFLLFLRKGLKLDEKTALVTVLLLIFQVAALRESWDRFRNVLALSTSFVTLTVHRNDYRYKWWIVGILAGLTAFSREYIAFGLVFVILCFALLEKKDRIVSLLTLTPAIVIFSIIGYLQHIWNYLPSTLNTSDTYLLVTQDIFSIFAVCYLPLLPFVAKGFKRDKILDPMFYGLLLGSFGSVVSVWITFPGYQRWLVLLVFPLSIYATKGFELFRFFDKKNKKRLYVIFSIFIVIGTGYSSGLISTVVLPNTWVPTNMVQSSIKWSQIDDVKSVLAWLENNAPPNSTLLTEERFLGWAQIYLELDKNDIDIVPYAAGDSPFSVMQEVRGDHVYLIWYSNEIFTGFNQLYSKEEIAIFEIANFSLLSN